MKITIRTSFWGDHRSLAQHQAHDHIERARWRWRVARNLAKRAKDPQPLGWLPAYLRTQAL